MGLVSETPTELSAAAAAAGQPTTRAGRDTVALEPLLLLIQTEFDYAFPSDLSLSSPSSSISTASSTVIDPAIVKVLCLLEDADDV
jgi:hypothetical protein